MQLQVFATYDSTCYTTQFSCEGQETTFDDFFNFTDSFAGNDLFNFSVEEIAPGHFLCKPGPCITIRTPDPTLILVCDLQTPPICESYRIPTPEDPDPMGPPND